MSKGVNKVIILGNLGNDPEVRAVPNGSMVTTLSIATSESWKDKNTGEKHEKTEWHRIIIFNRLAEVAGQYLKKGSKVYIEGSLRTRKWKDKDGQDRYTTEIIASEMQMLDARNAASSDKIETQTTDGAQNSQNNPLPQDDFEGDIPF